MWSHALYLRIYLWVDDWVWSFCHGFQGKIILLIKCTNYVNRGLIIGKVANSVHDCIQDLLFDCVAIDAMRPGSIDKQLGWPTSNKFLKCRMLCVTSTSKYTKIVNMQPCTFCTHNDSQYAKLMTTPQSLVHILSYVWGHYISVQQRVSKQCFLLLYLLILIAL